MTGSQDTEDFKKSAVYTTNQVAIDKYAGRQKLVVGVITGLVGAGATVLVGAIMYRLGKRNGENEYRNMY